MPLKHHFRNLFARHTTFWLLMILFAIALVTRLWHIELPINFDENYWVRRGVHFYVALLSGKLEDTFLRHHPGVTNLWLIGAAFSLRYLLHDIMPLSPPFAGFAEQSDSLLGYLRAIEHIDQMPLEAYTSARFLAAFVTAGSMVAFYWLSRRLLGNMIALIATMILLFEPFFVAYQRSLTTDANQTNFTWLALLAFLLYLQHKKEQLGAWRWLFLSAGCYALALLSKIPALLSLPALALWLLWYAVRGHFGEKVRYGRLLGEIICWGLIVGAVIFLFWPALWVALPETGLQLYQQLSEEVGGHEQFFMGQMSRSPGAAFYPVVLFYRLSPLLLFGLILCCLSLLLRPLRPHDTDATALWAIALNLLIVLILLDSRASKIDRYIVPLIPGIALLAAAGILRWGEWASGPPSAGSGTGGEGLRGGEGDLRGLSKPLVWMLGLIGVIQLATFCSYLPYHLTYFNPLWGGTAGAKQVLMIGNGELLDQAAVWLNQERPPFSQGRLVASWYDASFAPYYRGATVSLSADSADKWPWVQAQRVVLYVNQFQRQGIYYTSHTDYFTLQDPLHTIRAYGVDYAQIYAGPIVEASALAERAFIQTSLDFDSYATLLGYELQRSELAAGEAAIVTLYWQAQEPFPSADYYVNLSIRHPNGLLLNKEDQLPVHGFFPVTDWQSGQIIRDVHAIEIPPGSPPAAYSLEVGLYSPQQGQGLEIRDEERAGGQQVALTTLQVTRSTSPLAKRAVAYGDELQIASPIAAQKAPSLNGARLLGYEWASPAQLRAGEGVAMTLLWQAGSESEAAAEIPHLYLRLSSEGQQWQRAIGHPLGGSYSPEQWRAGELVRDIWLALLPPDAPTGQYQLDLVAQSANQSTLLLDLGQLAIESRPHDFQTSVPRVIQQADLGNSARLLGYDISASAQSGQALDITLYWQALGELERNYTRFVHLLNEEGQLVAQRDSVPGEGQYPTTIWVKGEILKDNTQINLPAELPPAPYRLIVGFYDPATWERLPNNEGTDHILLKQPVKVR
jgi:4-amino-4-deoxy-L-arabinose transferase-like glycosyltransferase